jgi:hypothetical protein
MKLQSFKYTNSFYTININNNYFYYQFLGGSVVSVSLTSGNYDIDSLLNYLSVLLFGLFTFSYNESTMKITINSVSGITFSLVASSYNCFEVLGFDTEISTSYSASHTAPYLMNLMGIEVLHITVPNINLNSVGVKNQCKYNILDSVHVNAPKGESETYINYSNLMYKINENNINFLNIVILDQDMNIIDFNYIDWYINILFDFAYIPDLILPKSLQDINIENDHSMYDYLVAEERKNINDYLIQNKNI